MLNRQIQLKFVNPKKAQNKQKAGPHVEVDSGDLVEDFPDFETIVNAAASLIVVYVITDTFRRVAFARAMK
jgi:hypothetical protein